RARCQWCARRGPHPKLQDCRGAGSELAVRGSRYGFGAERARSERAGDRGLAGTTMTCVLVVEDDRGIQWMIADDLADRGHTVLTACDGKEALECLRGTRPEVIVLDLVLPRVDGWEFARRYRTITGGSAIPIVVVSAARVPELAATPSDIVRWF